MAPSRLKKSKQKAAERLDLLSSTEMTITIFIICIYYMPFEMYEKDGILTRDFFVGMYLTIIYESAFT